VADLARKNIKFIIALTQFSGDESEKEFAAAVPEVSMVIGAEGIVSNARRGEGMMAKRVEQGFSRVLKLDIGPPGRAAQRPFSICNRTCDFILFLSNLSPSS